MNNKIKIIMNEDHNLHGVIFEKGSIIEVDIEIYNSIKQFCDPINELNKKPALNGARK